MPDADRLYRFLFEQTGIRGNLVHLDASWRAVLDTHDYPDTVRTQLGQSLAAVMLLSATIKLKGSLILQAQGNGPLRTLVAQATSDRTLRGLARWQGPVPDRDLGAMFGNGRLVLTIERPPGEPYQGIVALDGVRMSDALESYFRSSEQLTTRLWLAASGDRAAGLLLQQLPGQGTTDEDWNRIGILSDTLTDEELLNLNAPDLLHRLFNEEQVRLFEPEPVAFRCGCSRARIESTLVALGRGEVDDVLEQRGEVEVTCEFCNRQYRFDPVDIEQVFAEASRHDTSSTRH